MPPQNRLIARASEQAHTKIAVSQSTSSVPQPITGVSSLDLGRSLRTNGLFLRGMAPRNDTPSQPTVKSARASLGGAGPRLGNGSSAKNAFEVLCAAFILCNASSASVLVGAAALLGRFLPRLGPSLPDGPFSFLTRAADVLDSAHLLGLRDMERRGSLSRSHPNRSLVAKVAAATQAVTNVHKTSRAGLRCFALQHRICN